MGHPIDFDAIAYLHVSDSFLWVMQPKQIDNRQHERTAQINITVGRWKAVEVRATDSGEEGSMALGNNCAQSFVVKGCHAKWAFKLDRYRLNLQSSV